MLLLAFECLSDACLPSLTHHMPAYTALYGHALSSNCTLPTFEHIGDDQLLTAADQVQQHIPQTMQASKNVQGALNKLQDRNLFEGKVLEVDLEARRSRKQITLSTDT